jgi:hypothetical protein
MLKNFNASELTDIGSLKSVLDSLLPFTQNHLQLQRQQNHFSPPFSTTIKFAFFTEATLMKPLPLPQ